MRAPSAPPDLSAAPPARPLAPVVAERQRCPGCDTAVVGRFCPECGQSHQDVRVRFGRWVRDYMDDTFHLDSRFFRSLWALVRRPGELTHAYVAGERSRWVRPFRLYLMASALYFLLFSVFGPRNALDMVHTTTLGGGTFVHFGPRFGSPPAPDAPRSEVGASVELPVGEDTELGRWVDRIGQLPPERMQAEIMGALARNLPKAMFLLVPVFALLVKALHRQRYYAEHFVFALHVHAFGFLVFAAILPLPAWTRSGRTLLALGLVAAYLFLAQRRVYANGRVRTGVKTAALYALYGLVLLLTVGGIGVVAILTLEA